MSNVLTMEKPMAWTFRKLPDGDLEVHDGNRVRSIIQKRPGPRGWVVHRIGTNGRSSGCDNFKTLGEAKWWATNEKIFRPHGGVK
jgi:hypothetical protein